MDYRTKREKLEAMANQTASPQEAEVAKNLLAKMPPEDIEYRPAFQFYFNGTPVSYYYTASANIFGTKSRQYNVTFDFNDIKPSGFVYNSTITSTKT